MTLEETIKYAEDVAEENQRVVDTGIVFDDVTVDMLYCDDTEVIEEHLANYQMYADKYRQIAEWLKDYKRLLEDDAISRKAVLDAIEDDTRYGMFSCFASYDDSQKFKKVIKDLQPVNPQPKTGYWVEETINGVGRKVFCSKCSCPPPFEHINTGDVYSSNGYGVINKTKFCPSCGAKMIEPKESEEK